MTLTLALELILRQDINAQLRAAGRPQTDVDRWHHIDLLYLAKLTDRPRRTGFEPCPR